MRRFLVLFLVSICFAQIAAAVDTNRKRGEAAPNQIDMPFLIAPASRNETLIGFHYISYRLVTPSPKDAGEVREKLAFVQDAYVRDVYKTPVGKADDQTEVDQTALHDRLIAIVKRIVGGKKVTNLFFLDIKYAPLHPKPGGSIFSPSTEGTGQPATGLEKGPKLGTTGPATSTPQKDGKP